MSPQELQNWLQSHENELSFTMDYELYFQSDQDFAQTLDLWFDSPDWRKTGHHFIHLGGNSMGSSFALWIRPGHDSALAPIAYFGDEGGGGILARDTQSWAQIIAHAPRFDQDDDTGYFIADTGFEFYLGFLEEDGEDTQEVQNAYDTFQAASIQKFGSLPELEDLTANLDELNAEFAAWMKNLLPE